MEMLISARHLANYIISLENFSLNSQPITTYNHMGALISDSILQAGVNYQTVVFPRINRILNDYPKAITTSAFMLIIEKHGPDTVLKWSHPEKPRRLFELTSFFIQSEIESEKELRDWIIKQSNCLELLKIKGVGQKTVDYLKKLVGLPTVAVDRHMKKFVACAGLNYSSYEEIKTIVEYAADLLEVNRSQLDYAIWSYLASGKLSFRSHLDSISK